MPKTYYERSIAIIKEHVEKLGLDKKTNITLTDLFALRASLRESFNTTEAVHIEKMKTASELTDFIVNTLYGDEP